MDRHGNKLKIGDVVWHRVHKCYGCFQEASEHAELFFFRCSSKPILFLWLSKFIEKVDDKTAMLWKLEQ